MFQVRELLAITRRGMGIVFRFQPSPEKSISLDDFPVKTSIEFEDFLATFDSQRAPH